ncbi:hypothetical protein K7640_27435 [Micromonospora sp. PLK6-60]|uniref:hypothetical protein n=1 Tax=Micromonospora sp. PLK6-60 TaxID=2873383 RepID=UPI001CA6FAD5|nr:hypothetical protein [Micromonospora sp. PLK6-60]MBY8875568.1 hypothetical protein [Micromonospora sp. PLK6-60]
MEAALIAIVVAALGYAGTYITNLNLSRRNETLARITRQLSELYGPLLAYTESNGRLFVAWESSLRADKLSPYGRNRNPSDEELAELRLWMQSAFIPNVRKARDVVIQKADLLIESEMPEVLLEFCAHVGAYDMIMKRWEAGDHSNHWPVIRYPRELNKYARSSFRTLKERQVALLGYQSRRLIPGASFRRSARVKKLEPAAASATPLQASAPPRVPNQGAPDDRG